MSKALKTLSITLILLLSTLVAFSIERDSLLVAVKKGSNRIIVFDQKIKVTLKNNQTYKGKYRVLNDSTIIINDVKIKLSEIESIRQFNRRNIAVTLGSVAFFSFKMFVLKTILFNTEPADPDTAMSPTFWFVSYFIAFITALLVFNIPIVRFRSKYEFKILPPDQAYSSNIALRALGLLFLGTVLLNILRLINTANWLIPILIFVYNFGILLFFKGYINSFYAMKVAKKINKNRVLPLINIFYGSAYLISNILLNLLLVAIILNPPDIVIDIVIGP